MKFKLGKGTERKPNEMTYFISISTLHFAICQAEFFGIVVAYRAIKPKFLVTLVPLKVFMVELVKF